MGKTCPGAFDVADGDGHGMAMRSGLSESSSINPCGCDASASADWADCGTVVTLL